MHHCCLLLSLGASTIKYPCLLCKGTFKSTRTRQQHMKTQHKELPAAASKALYAGQQMNQNIPIISPISIYQPSMLQVGPNGPLQKVDANIDTEPIRRLIESLGNVQKVNQVVILGQVPPNAPPLEVQQMPQMHANPHPPQIDCISINPFNSMEQTFILEPITPDGQMENPSFSELGSYMAVGENIELTLVQTEDTERPGGEVIQQPDIGAIQSDPVDQIIYQNEVEQDLEQTIILELVPTVELEQSQTVPYGEILSSCLVPTTDLENTADQTVSAEQESNMPAPLLMTTFELELTPLQTEQHGLPSCPLVPPDALSQTTSESETNPKEEVASQMKTVNLDQGQPAVDGDAPQEREEKAEQEPSEKLLVDNNESLDHVENKSEVEHPPAKEDVSSHLHTKQVLKRSELPVNVMSAQELVKVRKRKPTKAFIFQGDYMQELVGSINKDDLQTGAIPAKRQRTKKSRLVKFGPQCKEKKNKKQKKPSQQQQPMQEGVRGKTSTQNPSVKKVASQKKERKRERDKKVVNVPYTSEMQPPTTQDPQVQQIKGDKRKIKKKKQKEAAREEVALISEHTTEAVPVLEKPTQIQQKDQPKKGKYGKRKKNMAKQDKVKTKTSTASADIPAPQITQETLLLLKGHKQPQLKVYKLDPSKASGQTQEASPHDAQTVTQESKGNAHKQSPSESPNNLTAEGKKKGGRPKKNHKVLSLLSSLQVSRQTPETLPTKPKIARKRKASSNVETEGVITSHSKRALECKECGQRFSDVSSLQKHKAVHIVESPSLTYTNGNVFEGVAGLDVYQHPKRHDTAVGVMNAASDWDTEPELAEMALEGRERSHSFPALIPSPSLPVPSSDVDVIAYENKAAGKKESDYQSHTSAEVHSASDQRKNSETPLNFTSKPPLSTSSQTKGSETGEPLASDADKQEEVAPRIPSSQSQFEFPTDEDIKEDLLLEVDLVTVGEQTERDEPTAHEDIAPQNKSSGTCRPQGESADELPGHVSNETTTGNRLTLHTVSCSTHHVEIKEEEEELLVQKKNAGKGAVSMNASSRRRRGTGCLKRKVISKRVSVGDAIRGSESVTDQDECQIVYEECPISSDSEMSDEGEANTKISQPETRAEGNHATAPTASLPAQKVVLESVPTSVEEVMRLRGLQGEEEHNESDLSPGIIFEKFLPSRQTATADEEPCPMTKRNNPRQVRGRLYPQRPFIINE